MANLTDNVKYLDLTGLGIYDGLIKAYSDNADRALEDKFDALIGNTSVDDLIEGAINTLKGTLGVGDSATLEAINDELDGIDSALTTLNGTDSTTGSVAKAIKDKVETLDFTIAQADHAEGRPVVAVSETDGIIDVTEGTVKAEYVTYTGLDGQETVSASATVEAALTELFNKVDDNLAAGVVKIYDSNNNEVNAITAGETFTIKQGTTTVGTINIALDMVISGGQVITAAAADRAIDENVVIGEKYIKLTIANSTDVLYIAVNDLYKDHTTELNAEKIQLAISNENVISASVVAGSIEKTDLTAALQLEISSAATVVNAKSTGHVQVAVTAASGSNPALVTVTENDIASAQDLSIEVTRAQTAEGEIAGKVGLTGNEGSKVYSTNVGGATVVADINTLDGRVDNIEDFIENLTAISSTEINALFPSTGE